MDPHSFFADPDPAAFLNLDPAAFLIRIRRLNADLNPGGMMNGKTMDNHFVLGVS